MLVTAMTMWTFAASLRAHERDTSRGYGLAFGLAAFTFCTLQNGIFALIFPAWAYLLRDGRLALRRIFTRFFIGWVLVYLFVSVTIGYAFLLRVFLPHSTI